MREIGRTNLGVRCDTLHAQIEEMDPAAAVISAGHEITFMTTEWKRRTSR